jgi:uncharacterized protein (DUF952 family)
MSIFHIATADAWADASATGSDYRPESLNTEGFVHCSLAGQVAGTLAGWFAGRDDLVLLEIDPAPLGDALVIEAGSLGETERFPHVYGAIPLAAVVATTPLALDAAGLHRVP